ncbi:hypothetical protein WBJ53_13040 [Spirosoma sp. SC4-14]|uniref:hypothetical protein n=1 Tax=Spirosoma sp. SC4-14 TaxID=3128900 RepID=UPI0030D05022
MKTAITALISLLVSACVTPETNINPNNTTTDKSIPSSSESEKTDVVPLGPVAQITEYFVNIDPEKTVTLNGTSVGLRWRLKNDYSYDELNRLIQQKTTLWNTNYWEQLSYRYTPDLVQRYQNADSKDLVNVLLLNEKGFLKGNQEPDEYVYDADGFLISYKGNGQQDTYTVKDGNVIARETVFDSGMIQRNTYEYNLTKPSVPSPLTFLGQHSRNLLVKQTLVVTSATLLDAQTTIFRYYYDNDSQGRPIREYVVPNGVSEPGSVREFVYR